MLGTHGVIRSITWVLEGVPWSVLELTGKSQQQERYILQHSPLLSTTRDAEGPHRSKQNCMAQADWTDSLIDDSCA